MMQRPEEGDAPYVELIHPKAKVWNPVRPCRESRTLLRKASRSGLADLVDVPLL